MTGTDALGAAATDAKLAVLLERSKTTELFMETVNRTLAALTDAVNRVEKSQIQAVEVLNGRVAAVEKTASALNEKIDHKDQNAIARDAEQMRQLRDEETDRKAEDAELREMIKTLAATVNRNSEALSQGAWINRLITGAAGAAAGALAVMLLERLAAGQLLP